MKSNSFIAYKGNVTLKIMHGKKVVQTIENHNEGTFKLMQFLAYCLGSNYDVSLAPRYIMAYEVASDESRMGTLNDSKKVTIRPVATNFSPTYNNTKDSLAPQNDKCSVVLSFLLPSTLLDSTKKINRLAIYSSDDLSLNNYMAWIKVDPEIELSVGESILVLWEMTLQNVETPVVTSERMTLQASLNGYEEEENKTENRR